MATETDAAHGGAEAVGMPQLDFSTFPNQIFWLVITLVAIYLILSRVALPRIASVLSERQGTITQDIAAAEELKLQAQEAEAAYDKALADARAEAQRIIGEAKAEMQTELDAATAKAEEQIAAKTTESEGRIGEIRAGAMDAVRSVAEDAAGEILSVLGGKADKSALAKAIGERVKG